MSRKNLKEARQKAEYKVEYQIEDGKKVTNVLALPQKKYKKLIKKYSTKYHKERKYESFSLEDARELTGNGEALAMKGHVKTDSFEKTIAFLNSLTEAIWKTAQKHESFRMELFYNAETLNTNYCLFVPTDKSVSQSFQKETEDVILEQLKSEGPNIASDTVILDSTNFTPQDIYGQGNEKNYLYGMIKNPESGSIEMFPMNGDKIIIHGEQEAMFFIQRLIQCFQ